MTDRWIILSLDKMMEQEGSSSSIVEYAGIHETESKMRLLHGDGIGILNLDIPALIELLNGTCQMQWRVK